jgi:hypothetical protein
MKRAILSLVVAAVASLALAASVVAKDSNGQGPKGNGSNGKGRCTAGCKADERSCKAEERDILAACLDPCKPRRDAVRQACGENGQDSPKGGGVELSPECLAAVQALRTCRKPCQDAFRVVKRDCARTSRGCFTNECGVALSKGKCVAACVDERIACMRAPREALAACLDPCAPLADAVDKACGDTEEGDTPSADIEPSPECVAAKQALRECRQPCRDAYTAARRECRDTSRTCLADECDILRDNAGKPEDPNSPPPNGN